MKLKFLNCIFLFLFLIIHCFLCRPNDLQINKNSESGLIVSPQYNDIIMVGTISGEVYVIEGNTGEIKWSFSSGPPLINSSLKSIVPSIYGSIYLFKNDGLQKYPMSITDIVAYSPFSLGDGVNFLGMKTSLLFNADLVTKKATKYGEITLDEKNNLDQISSPMKMFIGRADHVIRAVDESSGAEIWNITVGEYVSSSHTTNTMVCQDTYVLVSNMDGELKLMDIVSGDVKWKIKLNSPALHVGGNTCLQKSGANIKGLIFQEQLTLHSLDSKIMVSDNNGTQLALEKSFLSNLISPKIIESNIPTYINPTNGLTIIGDKNVDWRLLECPSGIHHIVDHPIPNNTQLLNGNLLPLPDRFVDYKNNYDLTLTQFLIDFVSNIPTYILVAAMLLSIVVIIGAYKVSEDILNFLFGKENKIPPQEMEKDPSQIDENGVLRVGRLEMRTDRILGYGSSGTVVFEGYIDGRKAAIKRMLKQFYLMAQRETRLLIESDEHPNVVRYYATEEDQYFVYLALSYAESSIHELVESPEYEKYTFEDKMKIIRQLVEGVEHLHKLKIVHRDIKPQNVLIDKNGNVKISDMGLAKKLANDNSSTTLSKGTIGWQAPEIILQRGSQESDMKERRSSSSGTSSSDSSNSQRVKVTKKVDIFSLGCLIYYILTGNHPFGDNLSREYNIINRKYELSGIDYESKYLISRMIAHDPKDRYTIGEVNHFPLFWSASKKLQFLKDASDLLEFEKPNSDLVLKFEYLAAKEKVIHNNDWMALMHEKLLVDLHKYRKYNHKKLRDLLRVIRNKAHHYRDLDPVLQEACGPLPDGFLNYFLSKFPKLFLFTYLFMKEECKDSLPGDYFLKDSKERISLYNFSLDLEDNLDCPPGFEHIHHQHESF